MFSENLPDPTRQALEKMLESNPEYVAKYGNPFDETDPRNWSPSDRKAKGVSLEDRLALLELDVEGQTIVLNKLTEYMMAEQSRQLKEEMLKDPEGFLRKLLNGGDLPRAEWGPGDDKDGARYAGSTEGVKPDQLVPTPDGMIRADQIPGYRNDPAWRPSPDWVDANCTCPTHVAQREAASHKQISDDDGFPTGFYL